MLEYQWSNTLSVTIGGTHVNCGIWDTFGGGDTAFDETKYAPGGMGPQKTKMGIKTVNNVTLGRELNIDDRDDAALSRRLMQLRYGVPATVSRQALGDDGLPFGKPTVYSGQIMAVAQGDNDSNSSSTQVWTVTVSTDANIS